MTTREAILRAVSVFAARARDGDQRGIRVALEEAGIPATVAADVVEFLPVAAARALLDGMGIRFAGHYVRRTAQGVDIGQKALADEPVYHEGLAAADEIARMGDEVFLAVAGWSSEYQAVSRALNAGTRSEDLELGPPVMLANSGDRRTFDDTSGGVQPREKAWWQFWK